MNGHPDVAALGGTLVIQPLPGIGDMIWHLPFIQAIARHEGEVVCVLTKRRSFADQLLADEPAVRAVLWLERDARANRHGGVLGAVRLARDLRRHTFRRVWVLHASPRYALAAYLAGIPERLGYGVGRQRWWLNDRHALPPAMRQAHPIDKAKTYLDLCGIAADEVPRLHINAEKIAAMRAEMAHAPRPWVALGIGSSMPEKNWGAAQFGALTRAWLGRFGGTLFPVGAAFDAEIAQAIERAGENIGGRVIPILGRRLDEVSALLGLCDLYVGNDTGMLNVAAATGIPAIGLVNLAISARLDDPRRGIFALYPESGLREGRADVRSITVDAVMRKMTELIHHDA